MNRLHLIFCLALVCLLFVSCDMPDYTDEINAAYFNAGGGSSSNSECNYGKYRCSNGSSQFCGYSGNDLMWLLSETCSYGCDSSTGKCKSASDSGDCRDIYECYSKCQDNNCAQACYDNGNSSGKSQFAAMYNCWDQSGCFNATTSDEEFTNCVYDHCSDEINTCFNSSDSGDSGNNQNNDPTDTGTEEPTPSACYPNPCENLANSTGTCTTTHDGGYFCGCNDGYNWRRKECVVIPKVLGNICTGQTKCFDFSTSYINCNSSSIGEFYGQDAHYAAQGTCIPKKFKIDSSISNEKTVVDENLGLEWQQTIPTESYYWEDAVKYCEELNYGGHDDWRLPTINELVSIVDYGKNDPAIDATFFPDTPNNSFWSSSTTSNNPEQAWLIDFVNGEGHFFFQDYHYDARCVRGKSPTDTSSFSSSTKNGDEIITDTKTGLIWQKNYTTKILWSDSLLYCENSTYAGYTDWRVPNINEILSLINYEEYWPASDFPDIITDKTFWTSSSLITKGEDYSSAYVILTKDGSFFPSSKAVINHLIEKYSNICVR